jgi:hypothetical protein
MDPMDKICDVCALLPAPVPVASAMTATRSWQTSERCSDCGNLDEHQLLTLRQVKNWMTYVRSEEFSAVHMIVLRK